MSAALRAAVIGLGVGERHIAGYQADPRCEVVALCDLDAARLDEVGARHPGCRLTTDAAEVLAADDIDVVSVASYEPYHCDQVVAALESGKHVFVEKPLCTTDTEFERIDTALLANPGVRLSSNLVLRRNPQFIAVRDRIRDGVFGQLYYVEGDYNYGRLEKITDGWRGRLPFYSVSHGGAIHMIDLILWLSGARVAEVVASGNQICTEGTAFRFPDMVSAMLRFDDGMVAKVAANFGCVMPHHHALAVHGTRASFVHTRDGGVFYESRDPGVTPERLNHHYETSEKVGVQRAFVAQILDGAPAEVTETEVMDAMAVSLAVERSLASGKWEPVRYARVSQRHRGII